MKVIPNPKGYGKGEGVIIKLSQEKLKNLYEMLLKSDDTEYSVTFYELYEAIVEYYNSFPKN